MQIITTSYLNENYYIINGEYESLYLTTVLEESIYAEEIAELFRLNLINREQKNALFVEKKGLFGSILSNLIKENKIKDEQLVIRRDKLVNALIHLNLEEVCDKEMLSVVSELVKKQYDCINVTELSEEYDAELLKQIVALGMKPQKYLNELNSTLTGYEEEGYLCDDGKKWYMFNVVTKDKKVLRKEKVRSKGK